MSHEGDRRGVRRRARARAFVDPRKPSGCLDGSVLDYDTSLLSKGFTFSNPHATRDLRLRESPSASVRILANEYARLRVIQDLANREYAVRLFHRRRT